MLDLILAIVHHLLVFAIFGIIAAELMVVRRGMDAAAMGRVAAIDLWYGIAAAMILIVGFGRAVFAAKGWAYYSHNGFFWAKIATFAVIGLLSAAPTAFFIRGRRAGAPPADAQVNRVRRLLYAELALFPLLLIFAAAMARGYGAF